MVTTGAQLRPEEGQGGPAVCAQSRNKAIPGSRVQAAEFSRSEPLDQEVKTKLIFELVTGSEAHRWANRGRLQPHALKSEAPEAFKISRKLWMGCEREGIKLHASVRCSPGSNGVSE